MRVSLRHVRERGGSTRAVGVRLAFAGVVGVVALGAGAGTGSASGPCGGGVLTQAAPTATCTYTSAGEDTFSVPAGVTSLNVVAVGAPGEAGLPGGAGGQGARVSSTVAVPAGTTTLYVEVGGAGGPNPSAAGGIRDGGAGGFSSASGGGGGGSSDLRTQPAASGGLTAGGVTHA